MARIGATQCDTLVSLNDLTAMQASTNHIKHERERLRKVSARWKEQRLHNPTEAHAQQDHEFMDWRESQPDRAVRR